MLLLFLTWSHKVALTGLKLTKKMRLCSNSDICHLPPQEWDYVHTIHIHTAIESQTKQYHMFISRILYKFVLVRVSVFVMKSHNPNNLRRMGLSQHTCPDHSNMKWSQGRNSKMEAGCGTHGKVQGGDCLIELVACSDCFLK